MLLAFQCRRNETNAGNYLDCGMTHVTDAEVHEHLLHIAGDDIPPEEKDVILNTKFGEIRGPYVHSKTLRKLEKC